MSGLPNRLRAPRRIVLTPKQANIYAWGWQREARFRYGVCGRRFGKTFLMMEEQRRAVRLAVERDVDTDNEIWYGAPTQKQARKNYWKRALRATPEEWIAHVDNGAMVITYHSGHIFRVVGLDNYDDLRGSGLFFFMGDEWADTKPAAWDETIRPMLSTCDGNAIFIGCVRGDTLVLPRTGMRPISDYATGAPAKTLASLDEMLWGRDRAFHAADGFWTNGRVPTKKLVTRWGFEIEASLPHPVLVMGDDGIPAWRSMSEIGPTDRVAIDRGMEVWGNVDPLDGWAEHVVEWRRQFDGKRGPKPKPVVVDGMTEDLAYFLGLWLAEGSIEADIGRVSITCGDSSVGEFLKSGRVAGLDFIERRGDQWCVNSYEFMELMRFIGMPLCRAPFKAIPRWVMQGRREWATAFIAGMWDGDGYCGRNASPRIGLNSASKQLVSGLQLLLTNIGVMSRVSEHVTPPTDRVKVESIQHRLTVQGCNIGVFRDAVRLRIARKQATLDAIAVPEWSRRDGVPHQGRLMRLVRNSLRRTGNRERMRRSAFAAALVSGADVSYRTLREFVAAHADTPDQVALAALVRNLDSHYYWDEVSAITDGECETFDFTIPDTHSFWSNGFISHNTPKGYNHFYDGYAAGLPGDGRHPRTMSWHYTTLDGGNVPPEEIEEARKRLDERTFRQEYMASFETYAGLIYYAFDRHHNIKRPPWSDGEGRNWHKGLPIRIGLDFNIDPMTAHVYQEVVIEGRIHSFQIDEIHIKTSNTHEMGNEIAVRYGLPSFNPDVPKLDHITIYPDPAGAQRRTSAHGETDITILRKMGFHVWSMSSHPMVRDRINLVNGKLCSADGVRTMFIAPECQRSIEALEKQAYKEGTSEPDKTTGFDHDNDAMGYYVYTRFAHQKARPDTVNYIGR